MYSLANINNYLILNNNKMIKRTLPSVLNNTHKQLNSYPSTNKNRFNPNLPSIQQLTPQQDQPNQRPSHIQIINPPNSQDNHKIRSNSRKQSQQQIKPNMVGDISRKRKRIFTNDRKNQYENQHNGQPNSEDKFISELLPKMDKSMSLDPNIYSKQRKLPLQKQIHSKNQSPARRSPQKSQQQSIQKELKNKIAQLEKSVSVLKQQIQKSRVVQSKNVNFNVSPTNNLQPQISLANLQPSRTHATNKQPQLPQFNQYQQPQIQIRFQPPTAPVVKHIAYSPPPQAIPIQRRQQIPIQVLPLSRHIQGRQILPIIQNPKNNTGYQKQLFDKCMKLIEQNQRLQEQLAIISSQRMHTNRQSRSKSPYSRHIQPHIQQFCKITPVRKRILKPFQTCQGVSFIDGGVVQSFQQHCRYTVSPMDFQNLLNTQDYRNYRDIAEFTRQIQQNDPNLSASMSFNRSRSLSSSPSRLSITSPLQLYAKNNILVPSPPHHNRILISSPRKTANFASSNDEILKMSQPSNKITPAIKIKSNSFRKPEQTLLNRPILTVQTPKQHIRISPRKRQSFNYPNSDFPTFTRKDRLR